MTPRFRTSKRHGLSSSAPREGMVEKSHTSVSGGARGMPLAGCRSGGPGCVARKVCGVFLLLAATLWIGAARGFEWVDDDWSGGAYQSAMSVNPEVDPGRLVLQDDLRDIRYIGSPTDWQGIYCMAVYHDTLFLAASDYPFSYVGAEILTYDYLTDVCASSCSLYQEGILILKVFGDSLWSPNPDPVEPVYDGGSHLYNGHRWIYKDTIDSVYHVDDMEIVNGVMYATTGNTDGSGRCLVSRDMGDTWTEALRIRTSPDMMWRRMFGAGQHQGRVFIQPDGYEPEGRVVYSSANGVDWDTLDVPGMPIDKHAMFIEWGDSLLMTMNNKLLIWDGSSWTWHYLPFSGYRWCRGYHIRAGQLYGGGGSCIIYRWLGGADWEPVAHMGLDPATEEIESIVTYYGRMYVSTSRSDSSQVARLYAAAVAPWGRLVSEVHDFGRLVEHGVLSWEAFEPNPQADVRFQVRSANSADQIQHEQFVGPDGTWTTYYTEPDTLASMHDGHRFFQYAASLYCPDRMRPPMLDRVTLTADSLSSPSAVDETPLGEIDRLTPDVTLRMLTPQPVTRGGAVAFQLARRTAEPGSIRVRIVGLEGRIIRSERIALHGGGETLWDWDLRDDAGRPVPSGVYRAVFDDAGPSGSRAVASMVVLR